MREFYYILIFCFSLYYLCSCSKDDALVVILDTEKTQQQIDSVFEDLNLKIPFFSISVPDFKYRGTVYNDDNLIYNDLLKGVIVHLFFYSCGSLPDQSECLYKALYYINRLGKMIPVMDDIKLPHGCYDIYVASALNLDYDAVPLFNNSYARSDYVYNGIDYVWGEFKNMIIPITEGNVIQLKLERSTVSMLFDFKTTVGHSINQIISVSMTSPMSSQSFWSLASGIISPSEPTDGKIHLHIKDKSASNFILHYSTDKPLEFNLKIEIDGETKEYNTQIPIPSEKIFQFGYRYKYDVLIDPERGIKIE